MITQEATSRFVQAGRWRLHYHEAGSGHPVILLHGSGPGATGWSNFAGNIGSLAKEYRVIAPDFPGWGASEELDPAKYARFPANVEAILGLMDALGIEKAALIGNSMGGIAAQMLTALHPARISHCVTMGAPAPGGPQLFFAPTGLTEGLKALFAAYTEPNHDSFRRLVEIMVFDPGFASQALIDERLDNALANPRHLELFLTGLATMHIDAVGQDAVVHALEKSTVPALIIHGRDDRVVGVEHSLRAAALMPSASLLVFNRCGHWAQLEHARRFNGIVRGFLSSTLP